MSIANLDEFKEYCLRHLGYPVIEINVDDTQIEDRIDEALQFFQEYNDEGTQRNAYKYTLTSTDITNKFINLSSLSPKPQSIVKVYFESVGLNTSNFQNDLWQVNNKMAYDLAFSSNQGNVDTYAMQRMYMNTVLSYLETKTVIQFDRTMSNRLLLQCDWTNLEEDDNILIDGYWIIDPTTHPNVWNNAWLKKYASALIGVQWGNNLSKFNNVLLPGGMSIDGVRILEQYIKEKDDLEEECRTKWQSPPNFLVG